MSSKTVESIDRVVIRFAGDSGDGMQLTGDRFTAESAIHGNDISTLPNFPAEIRAPQGTIPGVSSFQVHFANRPGLNPGDYCDVLVAMNPAALKANRKWLKRGATVIIDGDSITEEHLKKAGFATLDPLAELKLDEYNVVIPDITTMTREALIAGMGTGLIVTSLIGSSVNPTTGDYSRGASGFWVENGKIAFPVHEITIAGNLKDMLKGIEAVGADAYSYGAKTVGSILVNRMKVAGS